MNIKNLLLVKGDEIPIAIPFYLLLSLSIILICFILFETSYQPEIKHLMDIIPIMDCKELGEMILNGEIQYPEPSKLADKHWEIRCHGGLK